MLRNILAAAAVLMLLASCNIAAPGSAAAKEITSFVFTAELNSSLSLDAEAVIKGLGIHIAVPSEADASALIPTIVHTGKSISPAAETAADFRSPVSYEVTAADGSVKIYTVWLSHISTPQ